MPRYWAAVEARAITRKSGISALQLTVDAGCLLKLKLMALRSAIAGGTDACITYSMLGAIIMASEPSIPGEDTSSGAAVSSIAGASAWGRTGGNTEQGTCSGVN